MITRPFAYNHQTSPADIIPGTIQFADIAIGVDPLIYSADPGGVTWFMGPDEDPGWVICSTVPEATQPTPSGPVGTVRFWRSKTKDDSGFLTIANFVAKKKELGVTFSTVEDAYARLEQEGLWTSYPSPIVDSVFYQVWKDTAIWRDTDIWAD